MKPAPPKLALLFFMLALTGRRLAADCSVTDLGVTPLNEMGFNVYSNSTGGLYPNGANTRPPAHEAAGLQIATNQIVPLNPSGNLDTNNGKIVLLSLGVSNTTQEWASGDNVTHNITNTFKYRAELDPSKNPQVIIVDGAFGGQDAITWTNPASANWAMVITQRLVASGVTTNQVQALWLKQALANPRNYGLFPGHAQALQGYLETILRIATAKYPNLKLVYFSCRTRSYDTNSADLNPEPFAFETAFADKWVIQDQINSVNKLNFNSSRGPVVAPWLSWGPYIWADGLAPRSDGFVWLCTDLSQSDFTHPSSNGVAKVASQLLAFFKTDATTTPWFLKKSVAGGPLCAPTASTNSGFMPLTITFAANASAGSAPLHEAQWTFEDGDFATNANPIKTFRSPGVYHARLTVTDTNGNTAQGLVTITVNSKFDAWRAATFTAVELANTNISGASANPDGDRFPNLLEYAMGLEPKVSNS
ncbi:MAG TPA: PKD domain-containing protein, partial [Candidatus Dormibacteraeota bacterium]|nr:PKD domain-containing protein [Candidatus Dormibacteraeota bacterium]